MSRKFAADLNGTLRHRLERDLDAVLGNEVNDAGSAEIGSTHRAGDDLGGKAVPLVAVCHGFGRSERA
jgi:hypothetical protein